MPLWLVVVLVLGAAVLVFAIVAIRGYPKDGSF